MLGYLILMTPVAYLMQTRERSLPLPDFKDYLTGLPWAFVYLVNYARGMPMALGHLWSISCEMQFYLLAPLIFISGGENAVRRNVVWGSLLALLLFLGIAQPLAGDSVKYHFEFAVWPMMLGFFCEHHKTLFPALPQRLIKWTVRFALVLFVIGSGAMLATGRFKNIVIALGAVMFVPCFGSYVTGRCLKGWPGNFLGWIGARTYSIYLWQQPLTICRYLPSLLHPLGAIAAIGLGAIWFNLLERPFLSFKRRQA
jgi:peptidoglycan/LPS O-acetylase OafA/YrhL